MQQEYVTYKGIPTITACEVQKQLELQQWILDPSSRPYTSTHHTGIIARSAGTEIKDKKSIVQKQLELQAMILGY